MPEFSREWKFPFLTSPECCFCSFPRTINRQKRHNQSSLPRGRALQTCNILCAEQFFFLPQQGRGIGQKLKLFCTWCRLQTWSPWPWGYARLYAMVFLLLHWDRSSFKPGKLKIKSTVLFSGLIKASFQIWRWEAITYYIWEQQTFF